MKQIACFFDFPIGVNPLMAYLCKTHSTCRVAVSRTSQMRILRPRKAKMGEYILRYALFVLSLSPISGGVAAVRYMSFACSGGVETALPYYIQRRKPQFSIFAGKWI